MYSLTTIDGPSTEPVDDTLVKTHLAVGHNDDDAWIAAAIKAAREATEIYTGRRWITQRLRFKLATWPDCLDVNDPLYDADGLLRLPVAPVLSIEAVKYLDADGVEQTIDEDDIDAWLEHNPPVVGKYSSWPTNGGGLGAVRVEFTAGYGDAGAVPAGVSLAMLLAIGSWFENRGDQNVLIAKGLPPAAKFQLDLLWTGS